MVALPNSPYPRLQNDPAAALEGEVSLLRRPERTAEGPGVDLISRIDLLLAHLQERPAQGSSGANSEGSAFEARIAHLEASTAHLQRDVAQIRTDVRDMRERLFRLQDRSATAATRFFVAVSVLVILAALAGATAFEPQLQAVAKEVLSGSVEVIP